MRCPTCENAETKVVDSRTVDDGDGIRRRRSCLACSRRFTTFERAEHVPLVVVKRSGRREPFDRQKIIGGVAAAAKGRPIEPDTFEALSDDIEEQARIEGPEVTAVWIGLTVLDQLRALDQVACLRFASVYKSFSEIGDFEREATLIKLSDSIPS